MQKSEAIKMNLRIASSVGINIMEQTTELTIDQRQAILKSLAEQRLTMKDDQGLIICRKCYKVIRLSYFTDWIIWSECNDCAPQKFIAWDELFNMTEYSSRAEFDNRRAA